MRRFALRALLTIAAVAVLFCLLEGAASVIMVTSAIVFGRAPVAELRYSRYDPELGWASIPNAYVPDLFGKGKYVRINGQGFRAAVEFPVPVPKGKIRMICSGDSFTFGYGVDNDHGWCQLMSALDPRVESVNMGQGGYGLDQAFLWYLRDGAALDQNVHVFAFTFSDFDRMLSADFLGYAKPVLTMENGHLAVGNVPVPKASYRFRWFTDNRSALRQFRIVRVWEALVPPRPPSVQLNGRAADEVVQAIFDSLNVVDRAKGSLLVAVYLPTTYDYQPPGNGPLREHIGQILAQQHVAFIDLTDLVGALSPADRQRMFISDRDAPDFASAAGHYTEAGNAFVAHALYDKLRAMPPLAPPRLH